jgi:16S rRNA (cytosine1402-N4)-methyltransferase
LASVVCKALYRPGHRHRERIHPATRTFQALRIAVNHELENLTQLLEKAPVLLKEGGQLVVISFHSLEDRLVKNNFNHNKQQGLYQVITKRPLMAESDEISVNQRARSAKLRIAQRI